jgi:hypothetical protein
MANREVRGVVCALALVLGMGAGTGDMIAQGPSSGPPDSGVASQRSGPEIKGHADGRQALLTATYKGLAIIKTSDRADGSMRIDLRYGPDSVGVALDKAGTATVARGGRAIRVDSPEALRQLQQLLNGSDAIFAVRALLSERETTSALEAPEYSLLATAAFVASLVGDTDAPRRLVSRFVEKHRGIFRPVRFRGCWDEYSSEVTDSWNDLQACMDEANQSGGVFSGAYLRLACNAVWILRSESAWFEYIQCMNPLAISG